MLAFLAFANVVCPLPADVSSTQKRWSVCSFVQLRESDTLQRDDFACQICIPVAEMKTGIRSIAMKDAKGNVIPDGQAKLLVQVEMLGH